MELYPGMYGVIETPSKLRLYGVDTKALDALKRELTYTDKKIEFQIRKMENSRWSAPSQIAFLKKQLTQCLLFKDVEGFWTYPGFKRRLENNFRIKIESKVTYPDADLIPYEKMPTKKARYYQQGAYEKLVSNNGGAISLPTGSGKSHVIQMLIKNYGLKTLVITPSINISEQLFSQFEESFGKKKVGMFFDSKKEHKKLITVASPQSLIRLKPDSPAWNSFASTQVFISDESHTTPVKTQADICFGLVKNAPYRFFVSATQTRIDGLELLLEGIIGPTLYEYNIRQAIDDGFLACPRFKIVRVDSTDRKQSDDANEMTRRHLYYNPEVNRRAAEIANSHAARGEPVLILIDEIEQFDKLRNGLKYKVGFAHGTLTNENRKFVPTEYQNQTPSELVEQFNNKQLPILIGTSCISTGTDIRPVKAMIYLVGGKSEIAVKQGVGRCTRIDEGKTECKVYDFDVENIPTLHRHLAARCKIYKEISGDIEIL